MSVHRPHKSQWHQTISWWRLKEETKNNKNKLNTSPESSQNLFILGGKAGRQPCTLAKWWQIKNTRQTLWWNMCTSVLQCSASRYASHFTSHSASRSANSSVSCSANCSANCQLATMLDAMLFFIITVREKVPSHCTCWITDRCSLTNLCVCACMCVCVCVCVCVCACYKLAFQVDSCSADLQLLLFMLLVLKK